MTHEQCLWIFPQKVDIWKAGYYGIRIAHTKLVLTGWLISVLGAVTSANSHPDELPSNRFWDVDALFWSPTCKAIATNDISFSLHHLLLATPIWSSGQVGIQCFNNSTCKIVTYIPGATMASANALHSSSSITEGLTSASRFCMQRKPKET